MSDAPASPSPGPQVQIDASRVLEIVREENPMAHEMAMRRATIEAQARLIEELTGMLQSTHSGDTVP